MKNNIKNAAAEAPAGPIKFDASKYEMALVYRIAKRAEELAKKNGATYNILDGMMDIAGCHCSGCILDLANLLACDDRDFTLDVIGIKVHLDHGTGKLVGGYKPKFALNVEEYVENLTEVITFACGEYPDQVSDAIKVAQAKKK